MTNPVYLTFLTSVAIFGAETRARYSKGIEKEPFSAEEYWSTAFGIAFLLHALLTAGSAFMALF